jgi:hypothetical protein
VPAHVYNTLGDWAFACETCRLAEQKRVRAKADQVRDFIRAPPPV